MATTVIRYVIFDSRGNLLPSTQIYKAKYWNIEYETPKTFRYKYKYEQEFPSKFSASQKRFQLNEELELAVYNYQQQLAKRREKFYRDPDVKEARRKYNDAVKKLGDDSPDAILAKKKLREKISKAKQKVKSRKTKKELKAIQKEILKDLPKDKKLKLSEFLTLRDYFTTTLGAVKADQFIYRKVEIWIDSSLAPVMTLDPEEDEVDDFYDVARQAFAEAAKRIFTTGPEGKRRFIVKLLTPHLDMNGVDIRDKEKGAKSETQGNYTFGFSSARDEFPINLDELINKKVPRTLDNFMQKAVYSGTSYLGKNLVTSIMLRAVQIEELFYMPESIEVKRNQRQNPMYSHTQKIKKKKKQKGADLLWDLLRSNLREPPDQND